MLRYFFWCSVLFFPLTLGTNTTLAKFVDKLPNAENSTKTSHELFNATNKTTIALMSEGGSTVIQNTPSLTLLKDNLTIPITLEKELNGDKTITSSNSKVVPRKGVNYTEEITNATLISTLSKIDNGTDQQKHAKEHVDKNLHNSTTTPLRIMPKNKNNTLDKSLKEEKINKVVIHKKKPLILSYDLLSNTDKGAPKEQLKIPAIISSSKTLTPEQVPSPKESGPTAQILPMNASRHPGVIMPVVIIMLVVPMFAVLGYMALRCGQEAWKNRHYKRMDFLLDGMYND